MHSIGLDILVRADQPGHRVPNAWQPIVSVVVLVVGLGLLFLPSAGAAVPSATRGAGAVPLRLVGGVAVVIGIAGLVASLAT